MSNGHVTLDGLMFDIFFCSLFLVTVGFVRTKVYVRPHIFDDVVMHEVVKGGIFKFIGRICTNNCMVFCELHQDWFYFFSVYKTRMSNENVVKKFLWEVTQLCAIF